MIALLDRLRTVVFRLFRARTLGVAVIAEDGNGRVLLVRHTYGKGEWMLPGGGVKRRESFRDAALRETREEVGLLMSDGGTVELLSVYFKRLGGWVDHVCVFVVRGWTIAPTSNWEIAEVQLFAPDELPRAISRAAAARIREARGEADVSERW